MSRSPIATFTCLQPFALASIYEPYWITRKLSTHTKQSRMGAAAYSMEAATLETYTY